MTSWPDDVSVLIPAYKAGALLRQWLPDLVSAVPHKKILVVDDASGDDTVDLCHELEISVERHPVNQGKGGALSTGFAHLSSTGSRWIITMDADGQHAIEDLPLFVQEIRTRPHLGMIIGYRCMRPATMPLARIFSNRMTSLALSIITRARILDSQSGYRAYSCAMLAVLPPFRYSRFEMESEVILRARHAGFEIGFVPVKTLYFQGGSSHISHLTDTLRWMKAVVSVLLEFRRSSPRLVTSNPR